MNQRLSSYIPAWITILADVVASQLKTNDPKLTTFEYTD